MKASIELSIESLRLRAMEGLPLTLGSEECTDLVRCIEEMIQTCKAILVVGNNCSLDHQYERFYNYTVDLVKYTLGQMEKSEDA
jgi:hypothetical protein